MKKRRILLLATVALLLAPSLSFAYWEWTPQTSRWINPKYSVKETPEAQYAWAEEYIVKKDYSTAIHKLEQLIEVFPSSPYAAKARFRIGEVYQLAGEDQKAFQAYQKVIDDYPASDLVTSAVSRQFSIGEDITGRKRSGWFSFLRKDPAELLTKTVTTAPYAPESEKALYDLGGYYSRQGDFRQAIDTFDRLVQDYPDSRYGESAELKAAEAGLKLSRKQKNNEDLLADTSTRLAAFLAKYPESKEKGKAQKLYDQTRELLAEKVLEVARFYERVGQRQAAAVYYRKTADQYPDTPAGKEAGKKAK